MELLASFTTKPPVGAKLVNDTVPLVEIPPATVDGLRVTDATVAGVTVRVADFETDK